MSEELTHPLDEFAMVAWMAYNDGTPAIEWSELVPEARELFRSVADAVLMMRDFRQPAPGTAGDGRPAARVACEAFWAALHAPDSGTVHPDAAWAWAQTMGARHAWEAAVIAITALDGPAYAQLRSSLASQVAENAKLSAELERHHIALSSIARVNHAHDDGKLSATEAIDLVDSELSAFVTEDGEDPTNRDVDPDACDAADRNDFGDSE